MPSALSHGGRLFLSVGLVTALFGCESDGKKLSRLEREQATQCLLEQAYRDKAMTARYGPGGMTSANMRTAMTPEAESLGRRWIEHRTKCQLATRDYYRFMRR
jgi:hypothetical protein